MTLVCPLGSKASNHAGIRYDNTISCIFCPAGYYGNDTDRSTCKACPAGFYCPYYTGHGDTNPCQIGSYCPVASDSPTLCPVGRYGYKIRAEKPEDCKNCAAGSFNQVPGAKACKPCGSNSDSAEGAATCACEGLNRDFQFSGGQCVCKSGHIYYDVTDTQQQDGDDKTDCQQIVDTTCALSQSRNAITRACVTPSAVDCSSTCFINGGSFDVNLGK